MAPPKYNATAEEIMGRWRTHEGEPPPLERLTTAGDVNIYVNNASKSPGVSFNLSVDGAYMGVHVFIPCANPDTCARGHNFGRGHVCDGEYVDRRAAVEGLLQFTYQTILYSMP